MSNDQIQFSRASVSITVGIGAFLFPTDKHRLKTQIFTEILSALFICADL